MLNTIYEEFDFGGIKKDLQNKKIKIKRIVKNKDGQSVTESQIMGQSQVIQQSQIINPDSNANAESLKPTAQPNINMPTTASSILANFLPQQSLATSQIITQNPLNPNLSSQQQIFSTSSNQQQISIMSNNQQNQDNAINKGNDANIKNNDLPERKKINPLFYSTTLDNEVKSHAFGQHHLQQQQQQLQNLVQGNQQQDGNNNLQQHQQKGGFQIQSNNQNLQKFDDFTAGRVQDKQKNPMFMSQDVTIRGGLKQSSDFAKDLQHMMLPKSVIKMLNEQEKNIQLVDSHIQKEKRKIDLDIDLTIQDITEMLNKTRQDLHQKFDNFFLQYKENYINFTERTKEFKEKQKIQPFASNNNNNSNNAQLLQQQQSSNNSTSSNSNNNSEQQSPSSSIINLGCQIPTSAVNLLSVTYYGRDPPKQDIISSNLSQMDQFLGRQSLIMQQQLMEVASVKLKEEKCKLVASIENIQKEVEKRLLSFLAEELSKQSFHLPLYNHSETSQMLLTEIKMNMHNAMYEQLCNFPHLVYVVANACSNFKYMHAQPQISPLVPEDRRAVIGDYSSSSALPQNSGNQTMMMNASMTASSIMNMNMSQNANSAVSSSSKSSLANFTVSARLDTDHEDAVLCVLAISDQLIATGSADCSIKLWSLPQQSLLATMKGHTGSVNSLSLFRALPGEISAVVRPALQQQQSQQLKTQQLQKILQQDPAKRFETSVNYLVSGGGVGDNSVRVWDLTSFEEVKCLKGHESVVSCVQGLKDGQSIVSGSHDARIMVWDVLLNKVIAVITDHVSNVNCLHVTYNQQYIISGSNDRTIRFYRINYSMNVNLQRNVFESCVLEKTIYDQAQVYSLNIGRVDSNNNTITLFSGGSDAQIKLWNIQSGQCEREIVGHKSPVGEILLFENPFDPQLASSQQQSGKSKKNYMILSSGTSDECLRVSNPISPINNGISLEERIINDWGASCNPTMQVIKDVFDDSIRVLVVSQSMKERFVAILKIK